MEDVSLGSAKHGLLLAALTSSLCRCCGLRVSVSVNFSVPDRQDLDTKKRGAGREDENICHTLHDLWVYSVVFCF